jgi:hypothetical protein
VPVAAATIGSQLHLLEPGEAAAMILGALISIGASALAGSRAAHSFSAAEPEAANKDSAGKGPVGEGPATPGAPRTPGTPS